MKVRFIAFALLLPLFTFAESNISYFEFGDSAGSSFNTFANTGSDTTQWNNGANSGVSTDGSGNLLIQGANGTVGGSVFRKILYPTSYSDSTYRLEVEFDSWTLDEAQANNGKFAVGIYQEAGFATKVAEILLQQQPADGSRIQFFAEQGETDLYRNIEFPGELSKTSPAGKYAIEVDLVNNTVQIYTNDVAYLDTPQPIAADQVIGNLQFTVQNASESSTALINSFGLIDMLASSGGDGSGGGAGDGSGDGTGGGTDNSLVLSALEAFEFGDSAGSSFNTFANTGTVGSPWNYGGPSQVAVQDGKLVVGGVNGALVGNQTYRKIDYGTTPYSSGTYQLEIDFDALVFDAADTDGIVRWAAGSAFGSAQDIAQITAQANNGTPRIQFAVTSTNGLTVYRNLDGTSGLGVIELNLDDSTFSISTNDVALTQQALPIPSGTSIGALQFSAANFDAASSVSVDSMKFSTYVADDTTGGGDDGSTNPNDNTDASSHWDAHPDFTGVALEKFTYNEVAGKQPFAVNVSWGVANSGTTSSIFNFGGGSPMATDGNGNMVFYGQGRQNSGQFFRAMPKGETNGSLTTWGLDSGVYSLVVDFDSWDLDPAALSESATLVVNAYSGETDVLLGGINVIAYTNGNARLQLRSSTEGGVGNYRSLEFPISYSNAPKVTIEFDLDNDTVVYLTNDVVWQQSPSLTNLAASASLDSLQIGANPSGSTNSTVLVDGLAIYQRQNSADIPINAVAFSGADIGSSVFITGTNTLLNLDADNSVLTQWDAEGDWYGNNTNLTLSGQTFYQASQHSTTIDPTLIANSIIAGGTGSTNGGHGRAALVLQSGAGTKIQEQTNNPDEFVMEAGATSDAIILFKKDQFNDGLDTTNVTFTAAADTLSATIDYGGKSRMTEGRFSWVIQDGSAFYRSAPITMTHGNNATPNGAGITNVTAEALDVSWYNYDPTTDVAAIGTAASPTFDDIQAIGYLFGCTWVGGDDDGTGATQWARIQVSNFTAQADESVPVAESASWLSQYGLTDFNGDADGDGIVDLLEYALGLDPGSSDSAAISGQSSSGYILFNHPKRAGTDHGLIYTVQTNGNLKFGSWGDHSTVSPSESAADVTHTIPTSESDELFIRLKVELD